MSNGPEFVLFVLQHLEPPSVEEQTFQSSQNEFSAQGSNRKPILIQMFKPTQKCSSMVHNARVQIGGRKMKCT